MTKLACHADSLSDDIALMPTLSEIFGISDPKTLACLSCRLENFADRSAFVNAAERPAGKHGFVRADRDHFVFQGWLNGQILGGLHRSAYAIFGTTKENVREQAHRLAELGFNLVRIHHMDSSWVIPNVFGDRSSTDTQSLNPLMMEKLDWWIKCLEDEGIYVWLT